MSSDSLNPTRRPRRALIIGAGPVGGLTALALHKRGWQVTIWEGRSDPRVSETSAANGASTSGGAVYASGKPKPPTALRSINLAISSRGLGALRSVDSTLADEILRDSAIPMKGRMIHHHMSSSVDEHNTEAKEERTESQLYDPEGGECIYSLPRPGLNSMVLEALPEEEIELVFENKLGRVDWRRKVAYPKAGEAKASKGKARKAKMEKIIPGEEDEQDATTGQKEDHHAGEYQEEEVEEDETAQGHRFDLLIGCDGSWSQVRQEMMKVERMDFHQSFIPDAYIELHMPPHTLTGKPGESKFKMDENHLHIWPRHRFMLIGLPNKDGSFTLTLFAPFSAIEALSTRSQAEAWFQEHFPTALELAGKERLLDDFMNNPRGKLVTINASPSNHGPHALLLGDASHSMVPFYGQGLNCGLEDVRVFQSILDKHNVPSTISDNGIKGESEPDGGDSLREALDEYSRTRGADLEAICQLALENYEEMRSRVVSPMHQLRRMVDSFLSKVLRPTPKRAFGSASSSSSSPAFPTPRVSGWSSLYSMVTFRPDVPYSEALRKERAQKKILTRVTQGIVGAGLVGVGLGAWAGWKRWGTALGLGVGVTASSLFPMIGSRGSRSNATQAPKREYMYPEPPTSAPKTSAQLTWGAGCALAVAATLVGLGIEWVWTEFSPIQNQRPQESNTVAQEWWQHAKFVLPLLVPVTSWFVIANWVGWEYFRYG